MKERTRDQGGPGTLTDDLVIPEIDPATLADEPPYRAHQVWDWAAKGAAAYSGSKAYVVNFSRSLEMEYAGSGIAVQTILPGPVHSEFFEQSGITQPMFPENLYMTPEQLVSTSMKALDMKEAFCFPALHDKALLDEYEAARKKFSK